MRLVKVSTLTVLPEGFAIVALMEDSETKEIVHKTRRISPSLAIKLLNTTGQENQALTVRQSKYGK